MVAQAIAGLLIAGGGLPLAAGTASATPLTAGRSALEKPRKPDFPAGADETVDPTLLTMLRDADSAAGRFTYLPLPGLPTVPRLILNVAPLTAGIRFDANGLVVLDGRASTRPMPGVARTRDHG